MYFTTFLTCASLVHFGIAGYILEDDYSADKFFSMFGFSIVCYLNIWLRLTYSMLTWLNREMILHPVMSIM